jgi:hypothetical protein
MSTPKKKAPAARVPAPPHPLGATRAKRVQGWWAIATFGHPDETLVRIAKMALYAADAPDDKEAARRALIALGLHGAKKADTNLSRLREALDDLGRVANEMHPPPDPETGETPYDEARPGVPAHTAHKELMAEGVPLWLYRRVKGAAHGDDDTATQFLERTAKADPGTLEQLKWALSYWKAAKPATKYSRGRVR